MISIAFERSFEKAYVKLGKDYKEKVKERITLFMPDEFDPILNNHSLNGKYLGYRSINISGNLRAVYKKKGDIAVFAYLGNHNNLYK
jgi:addiction module RelE/StbE family toxin